MYYVEMFQLLNFRYRSIAVSYFRKADGILLLYDVLDQQTFNNVKKWIADVQVYMAYVRGVHCRHNLLRFVKQTLKNVIFYQSVYVVDYCMCHTGVLL